ncbi:MAG TPA: pyridoxamine 5'-phosphate oxidase [Paludibacteraceae bacterium]|jgi:pyridoxamine 5'-phosphate oxidase|nr:pyridoxamine 5'-phosphate oxidase [Porphyromonadaceae sp. NP-X]HOH54856.1 pyridoxamine 5'-phosphate oxidase [Paludibacteraceae bacterium]
MLKDLRKQYDRFTLNESNILENPFQQFKLWLSEAIKNEEYEPNAMMLSTVDAELQPHSRMVLLKELTDEGFVFFTNYEGNKGIQILHNHQVSLLFFWPVLERQVRITGNAEKISEQDSEEYFKMRPLFSQISAWASPQSRKIPSREYLDKQFEHYKQQFGAKVPRPPFWGGFLVRPKTFEFWQGRPDRMHDRLLYTKNDQQWEIYRLAP